MSRIEVPGPSWSPWQQLYGLAHRLRRGYWQSRARRLPKPVVSVGNLHWGGGGKTPLTAAIARHLQASGLQVAILSRGYGRVGEGVTIVSHGDGPLLGPRQAGDEPVLLAVDAQGAAVVVDGDRWRAGRHALERLDRTPDLFLLDDGFSHLRLHRDLDLLVFPAADPVAGGRLFPGGRLREPLAAAARADAVLFSGRDIDDDDGARLARALARHGFDGPGFVARTEVCAARTLAQGTAPPAREVPAGAKALAVSAIARPEGFHRTVEDAGFDLVDRLVFGDHHRYPEASLAKIRRRYEASGARAVVVTSKDLVKLQGRLELPLVEIPIRAAPEPAFFAWLDERVARLVEQADGAAP